MRVRLAIGTFSNTWVIQGDTQQKSHIEPELESIDESRGIWNIINYYYFYYFFKIYFR